MKKKDLINEISAKLKISKSSTEAFITAYEDIIKETISSGESIDLFNFMRFEVKDVKGRNGINPHTKEKMLIPSYKKVSVKPLKSLKDCVRN